MAARSWKGSRASRVGEVSLVMLRFRLDPLSVDPSLHFMRLHGSNQKANADCLPSLVLDLLFDCLDSRLPDDDDVLVRASIGC